MFYHIDGTLTEILPGLAVIDCGGVGYAMNVSTNTISHLTPGKRTKLYTYLLVREEIFELYGFYNLSEKRSFELLLGVSGVGPKAALSILSAVTPEGLAMAVLSEDLKMLTAAQGVGKKIAQRIILELRDRMAKENAGMVFGTEKMLTGQPSTADKQVSDAVAALTVLGYSNAEINAALKGTETEGKKTEEIIRAALRGMVK